ncbi:MAG: hemolysin family protein [Phycisphaerae bacterium]
MMVWLWLVLLLCCSGLVSASETALFALSRSSMQRFAQARGPFQRRVCSLMRRPGQVLMTVLIANTAVNVAIFAASFIALREARHTDPALAAMVSVAVLGAVITFGEIVPKTVALSRAESIASGAAAMIGVLEVLLTPLRWILRTMFVTPLLRLATPSYPTPSALTTAELKELVERSAHDGTIDSREHEMLQAVVEAGKVSTREIMTPRVDIEAQRLTGSRATFVKRMQSTRTRRLLVYGRDLDDVRGVIHARDLYLEPHTPISALLKPVEFVPEQGNLMQLLRHFHRTSARFAVVVDEYGGTAGLISIGHIIDWMLGTARDDEVARIPEAQRIDENTYRVSGKLSARLWADRFAARRIDYRMDTVGGLVLAALGRMPAVGDSVRLGNLTLTVERINRRRIEQILVKRDTGSPSCGEAQ